MTEIEERFARRAVRRKRLFFWMSTAALIVAAFLIVLYSTWFFIGHKFDVGPRAVIILLVLLNARQQLRQYKYATILEQLLPPS
ncbi:MAG TPA: hypothetical protein VFV19_01305 [Candidatus Polarisedimenticolaceae bacterium]|nr:hypothetical protein [Candidatus Polarisedimenticolaceae bacterium]